MLINNKHTRETRNIAREITRCQVSRKAAEKRYHYYDMKINALKHKINEIIRKRKGK